MTHASQPVHGVFVDVDVVLSGALPAVVAHHCAPHQLMPTLVVTDTGESALDRVAHIGDIIVAEGEAVAVVLSFKPPTSRTTGMVP